MTVPVRQMVVVGSCRESTTTERFSLFSAEALYSRAKAYVQRAGQSLEARSRTVEGRTVLALVGANAAVFCAWRVALRRPNATSFMFSHFTCSRESVQLRRLHTLLTTNVSHYDPIHLGVNMVVLYTIGSQVCTIITAPRFTQLYFLGGLSASLASVALKTMRRSPKVSLGASGSVMATVFMYAQLFPERRVTIFQQSISSQDICIVSATIDLLGAIFGFSGIDFAAHLGGAAFGYSYFRLVRADLIRERRDKIDQSETRRRGPSVRRVSQTPLGATSGKLPRDFVQTAASDRMVCTPSVLEGLRCRTQRAHVGSRPTRSS